MTPFRIKIGRVKKKYGPPAKSTLFDDREVSVVRENGKLTQAIFYRERFFQIGGQLCQHAQEVWRRAA